MEVVETVESLRTRLDDWRKASERIVLVPTMGNLHDGHLKLVNEAARIGRRIVVSIFVNPAQFSESEDFASYPRSLDDDIRLLEEKPVDLLFNPATDAVYPESPYTSVTVPVLSDQLCGKYRPGHFSGVTTVVSKLFNMVQPDVAVFGEKDFQQLTIIRKMVADLNFPVRIESVATVRESDGLAMGSRNRYLSAHERQLAPYLYKQICEAAGQILAGITDFGDLERRHTIKLQEYGFRPDYVSVRRTSDLKPAESTDCELVILAAAWLGKARLIDNRIVRVEKDRHPG
ncbi:MAG: pantoate--beta-alanine ligase [Methylococcales bacterium]